MPDSSYVAFTQLQEGRGFAPWGGAQEQRSEILPTAVDSPDAVAGAQARLRGLDLDGLRELYRKMIISARSAQRREDFMGMQLTGTLIRKEIRSRGASPHETLFVSVPAPIDPIPQG